MFKYPVMSHLEGLQSITRYSTSSHRLFLRIFSLDHGTDLEKLIRTIGAVIHTITEPVLLNTEAMQSALIMVRWTTIHCLTKYLILIRIIRTIAISIAHFGQG